MSEEPPEKKFAGAAGKIDRKCIYAVIPARAGSKGVKGKNIKDFCGKPLMAWQIANGVKSKYITRTFVSTDSEVYQKVAIEHGAEAPFLRPAEIAHDTATDFQLMEHFLKWMKENEPADRQPSLLVQLRPTAPCLTTESVDEAIEKFLKYEDDNYDSLRSVTPHDHEPFNMYFVVPQVDNEERLVPIIPKSYHKDRPSEEILEPQSVARQILPKIYWHNAYVDIIRPSCIREQGNVMGKRCLSYHMSEDDMADIDTPEQFQAAERKKKAQLAAGAPEDNGVPDEVATVALLGYPRGSRPEYSYGTAGFRDKAAGMEHIFFRMGVLGALRSKSLGGATVGVMVTASHNPEADNGVKLVEPMGEMLPISWEQHATTLANAADDQLAKAIREVAKEVGAKFDVPAAVIVGRDTRRSSAELALAVCDGVGAVQPSAVKSLGLATTPQVHYVCRCIATAREYGMPSLPGYVDKLVKAYVALIGSGPSQQSLRQYQPRVVLDCANGVGAVAMRLFLEPLKTAGLEVSLKNEGPGSLNEGCGADFVKLKQCQPTGVDTSQCRGLSFDGDADRVVYYFGGAGQGFRLLDGDRVALLLAQFTGKLLKEAKLDGQLRLGVVQTAYANGASTRCATEAVGASNVLCAKTGVKHCHHAALELDIGIYFEANGHGTILFSDNFVKTVSSLAASKDSPAQKAAHQLMLFRNVINEAVGDAISIMLAVEAVLRLMDWSCAEWLAMYNDLPNRQIKVKVANRGAFETTNAERTCVKPDGLQAEIDKMVAQVPSGRAFVRPSGTEDVVRVYVEAATLQSTLKLGQDVVSLVYSSAGGVGGLPTVS